MYGCGFGVADMEAPEEELDAKAKSDTWDSLLIDAKYIATNKNTIELTLCTGKWTQTTKATKSHTLC